MPLRLFRSRKLSAANVIISLIGASTFPMWFFLSLYLQDVLHYSPIKTGLVFLPMTLAIVVGSRVASGITARVGAKRLLIFGMTLLTAGMALLTDIGPHSDYLGELLIPGLMASFALPFGFIPSTIVATTGVKPQEAGLASAVVNTARLFGGALGLAVLATLATSHSAHDLKHPDAGCAHRQPGPRKRLPACVLDRCGGRRGGHSRGRLCGPEPATCDGRAASGCRRRRDVATIRAWRESS